MTVANTERPDGNCCEASLECAEELALIKFLVERDNLVGEILKTTYATLDLSRPISVVHGTVVPSDGIDKGRTIFHAWVEVGDIAVEKPLQKYLHFPLFDFYVNHNATLIRRYSVADARKLANLYGYTPWHTRG